MNRCTHSQMDESSDSGGQKAEHATKEDQTLFGEQEQKQGRGRGLELQRERDSGLK